MSVIGVAKIIDLVDNTATAQLEQRRRKPHMLQLRQPKQTQLVVGQRVLIKFDPKNPQTPAQILQAFPPAPMDKPFLALLEQAHGRWQASPLQRGRRTAFGIHNPQSIKSPPPLLAWMERHASSTRHQPCAQIRSIIGPARGLGALSELSLVEHNIPTRFRASYTIAEPDTGTQRDLQTLPFVTIDPADARDHDDAVFAKTAPNGGAVIFVAIADVAAYVTSGSALDTEAAARGNSVYLPDRVVPMLPEALSNDRCSLKAGKPRRAIIAEMTLDDAGNICRKQFYRATIRVAAQWSYEQAQAMRRKPPSDKGLANTSAQLWRAYGLLAKARARHTPLELDMPEPRLALNTDQTRIIGLTIPPRLEAHRLIEAFMICANTAVAEHLAQHKAPLLYRVHDRPDADALRLLRWPAQRLHVRLPDAPNMHPKHFNALIRKADNSDDAVIIQELILRCQAQAIYTPNNIGHYGLGLSAYTHFTSPIRRYSDILVHRALIRICRLGTDIADPLSPEALQEMGQHLSETERRAWNAERQCQARYFAEWASDHIGKEFDAHITGFHRAGMFVRLQAHGAQALVPMRALGGGYFRLIDDGLAIQNAQGRTFLLGAQVRIALRSSNAWRGEIDAELRRGGIRRPVRKQRH